MKDIKGHRWNPEEKCWFFPKSDNIIEGQIDIFKDEDMWIDPYVSDKALGKIKSPLDSIIFNKKEAKRDQVCNYSCYPQYIYL